MRALAVLATALVTTLLAASARANESYRLPWGGIGFAQSDRSSQASGDALGLSVDPTGQVVAALGAKYPDVFAYRFTPAGVQTARFKVERSARAIAVDAGGRTFTAGGSHSVTRWSPNGVREDRFNVGAKVAALAVDGDGGVYVASGTTVQRRLYDGAPSTTYGEPGDIGDAAGVAVGPDGHVYVADRGLQRVEEFAAGGALVRTVGDGLVTPERVGVDRAGNVLVAGPGSAAPPSITRFGPDGSLQGPVDAGMTVDFSDYGEPLLLAVAPQGDVYFTYNPDFIKIPAELVAAPRMLFDDDNVIGGNEYDALPVSIGRTVDVPTRVFPSLARGVTARAIAGPGLALGGSDLRAADVPAGESRLDLEWTVVPSLPGRHTVQFDLRGHGPDDEPTELTRSIAVYAIDGPHMRISGAAWLPRARTIFLAVRLDLGDLRIAPGERDVLEQLSDSGTLSTSLRAGGRKLPRGDFQIGDVAGGACVPFTVPRGVRGRRRFVARAAFGGVPSVNPARRTRVLRPRARVKRKSLLADCVRTSGLAGGPTR